MTTRQTHTQDTTYEHQIHSKGSSLGMKAGEIISFNSATELSTNVFAVLGTRDINMN